MNLTIDSGVPLPQRRGGPGRPMLYPFRQMEVNDSFFAAGGAARVAAYRFARKTGRAFAARKATEKGVHGYRIWRTA